MAQEQNCRECVRKAGKLWTSYMDSDLGEGLCPKAQGEVYICELTNQKVEAQGIVHIV
ncbi:MAG: hypothetical protein PHE24_06980 [Patescibacteria group bacterium]|nr:hypothetical protein [Patescibacteria group bacterium]